MKNDSHIEELILDLKKDMNTRFDAVDARLTGVEGQLRGVHAVLDHSEKQYKWRNGEKSALENLLGKTSWYSDAILAG